MKERDVDGRLGQDVVGGSGVRRVPVPSGVVEDGLGHAPEEEADADAAGEEHHEPGDVVEFWLVCVFAQLDAGVLAEVQHHHE